MRRVPDVSPGRDRPPPPRWVAYAFRPDCTSGLSSPGVWAVEDHIAVLGRPLGPASGLPNFFRKLFITSRRIGGQWVQEQAEVLQLVGLELGQAGGQSVRQGEEPLEGDDAIAQVVQR